MDLQQIFYLLAIAYFVSWWLLLILIIVVAFILYRKVKQIQGNVQQAITTLPVLSVVLPVAQKAFDWWKNK